MTTFPEEQLDSSAGYFISRPGQTLQNGDWIIIRKLGWGPRSSTWLALDPEDEKNIAAIKIYTVAGSNNTREHKILDGPLRNCFSGFPMLQDHFYEESPKGKHLCLVLTVLGPTIESYRLSNTESDGYLHVHYVKQIMSDILEPLCTLHKKKIIHGAVAPSNFLLAAVQQASDIREYISKSPNLPAEEVRDSHGTTYYVAKSQTLSLNFECDKPFENTTIYLSNFGHARFAHGNVSLDAPLHMLPPEAMFGGIIGVKADIWMLGLAAYFLLTGTELFDPSEDHISEQDVERTLSELEQRLTSSDKLATQDIPVTLSFLNSCLTIDPSKRPSAYDLLGDEFIKGGSICSCGWSRLQPELDLTTLTG